MPWEHGHFAGGFGPRHLFRLLALLLTNHELDIIAIIGVILLIGIVKRNAIMMFDCALAAERNEGKSSHEKLARCSFVGRDSWGERWWK